MKRFLLALFVLSTTALSAAWPPYDTILRPNGAMLGYDAASATWRPIAVSGDGKMVSDSVVTIGTATVNAQAPATTNLQLTVAAAPVPIQLTNLANRRSLTLVNTDPTNFIRVSFNSAVASASASFGTTIYPYGAITLQLPSTKYVSIWATATVNVDTLQLGD